MGIARGRFTIDTHVHVQRHAVKFKERGIKPDYRSLAKEMRISKEVTVYDNSPRLLYDMERYGVDMCVIMPAFGMKDEINGELVEKYPDKFVAMCNATEYVLSVRRGEGDWDIKKYTSELDRLLSSGLFKAGIGEGITMNPRLKKPYTWEERFEEICQVMEVARKHKVPVSYHTGMPTGYGGTMHHGILGRPRTDWGEPLFANDVAAAYPSLCS